jgi:serine/threonine protein kinase
MSAPEKIGKYQVQGVLGHGGMGVVYQCYDPAIARSVAVKAITKSELVPEDLKHAIARFRHEARAVGRLMDQRIVQIYDYGEDDEIAYIVMEMVIGKTLLERMKADQNLDLEESAGIILQLLEGIGHAHAQGVVHRDIKPSNILINEEGAIKIADFGIARTEASSLTQVGEVLGTVYYMSPEQFLGTEVGIWADLYSVGVIAYEMLTRRRPFVGNNAEVMHQMINTIPENPSMLNLKLSPAIDRVLQHALAKQPADRFQSAGEFASALREAIDAFIDSTQGPVTGIVRLKLYKGNIISVGRKSPFSMYREDFATFGQEDVYDQSDAEGFIRLYGLPLKVRALNNLPISGMDMPKPNYSRFKRD